MNEKGSQKNPGIYTMVFWGNTLCRNVLHRYSLTRRGNCRWETEIISIKLLKALILNQHPFVNWKVRRKVSSHGLSSVARSAPGFCYNKTNDCHTQSGANHIWNASMLIMIIILCKYTPIFLFSNKLLTKFHRVNPVLVQWTYKIDFYAVCPQLLRISFSSEHFWNRAAIYLGCQNTVL